MPFHDCKLAYFSKSFSLALPCGQNFQLNISCTCSPSCLPKYQHHHHHYAQMIAAHNSGLNPALVCAMFIPTEPLQPSYLLEAGNHSLHLRLKSIVFLVKMKHDELTAAEQSECTNDISVQILSPITHRDAAWLHTTDCSKNIQTHRTSACMPWNADLIDTYVAQYCGQNCSSWAHRYYVPMSRIHVQLSTW